MTSATYNQDLSNTLRIPIARLGAWEHPTYGFVVFTQKDFNDIKKNFETNELGFEPYLRYGHSRYKGASDGEPATAFLSQVQQEGEVLFGHFEAVDPSVVDEVKQGKYRYASAELTRNAHSKRLGKGDIGTVLTAVALTNAPFVPDLPQNQVLSNNPTDEHFFVLDQKEREMPDTNMSLFQKLSHGIAQILGVNPTAAVGVGEAKHGAGMENLAGSPAMADLKPQEQQFTASPLTDTPVYDNGKVVKGGDQSGTTYNPAEPHAAPDQTLCHPDKAGQNSDLESNDGNEALSQDGCCSKCEKAKADCTCEKTESLTASAHTDTPVYDNGKVVKGHDQSGTHYNPDEPHALSANGGETRSYRPMPEHRPEGPIAHMVALSQAAASAAPAAPAQTEQLSHGAVGVETPSASHTQEEGTTMPELNEVLTRMAEFEQKLSQTVSALDAEKAEKAQLQAKLAETDSKLLAAHQQLSQLATAAADVAKESAELKLSQRAEAMKAEGVPPVLVDEVVNMVKAAGFEQKLSMGGAEAPLADSLFGLLAKLPAENRIDLKQIGAKQVLSTNGAAESFMYEGVIKERMGQ